jgi:hypothetical protein
MPIRTANRGDTVQYRNTLGETRNMQVYAKQEPAPGTPASSTSTTGGTLAAATYSYRVSAVVDGIETQASAAKTQATTGATSTVTIDWSAVANSRATAHKVYGRVGGSELLIATVAMPTVTYVDTGSVTPAGALPAASTAVSLWDPYGAIRTGVAKATTTKSTNAYVLRY